MAPSLQNFSFLTFNANSLYRGAILKSKLLFDNQHHILAVVDTRTSAGQTAALTEKFSKTEVVGKKHQRIFMSTQEEGKRHTGGVLIRFAENILQGEPLKVVFDESPYKRFLAMVVNLSNGSKALICVMYISPNDKMDKRVDMVDSLTQLLVNLKDTFKPDNIWVAGDLNISLDQDDKHKRLKRSILAMMYILEVQDSFRVVHPSSDSHAGATFSSRTNIQECSNSRIDYIFASNHLLEAHNHPKVQLLSFDETVSDHMGVKLSVTRQPNTALQEKKRKRFDDTLLRNADFMKIANGEVIKFFSKLAYDEGSLVGYSKDRKIRAKNAEWLIDQSCTSTRDWAITFYDLWARLQAKQVDYNNMRNFEKRKTIKTTKARIANLMKKKKLRGQQRRELGMLRCILEDLAEDAIRASAIRRGLNYDKLGAAPTRYLLRSQTKRSSGGPCKVLVINDSISHDPEEINRHLIDVFSSTMNRADPYEPGDLQRFLENSTNLIPRISPETSKEMEAPISTPEVVAAIMKLDLGKAGGVDGVTVGLMKWMARIIPATVTNLVRQIAQGQAKHVAEIFTKSLVLIPKTQDGPKTIKNLRPIAIYTLCQKVVSSVLQRRLVAASDKHFLLPPEITSYKKGVGTSDSLHLLLSLIANAKHHNKKIFIFNSDIHSAYDCLSRGLVEEIMELMGIPQVFISYMKHSEEGSRIAIAGLVNGEGHQSNQTFT